MKRPRTNTPIKNASKQKKVDIILLPVELIIRTMDFLDLAVTVDSFNALLNSYGKIHVGEPFLVFSRIIVVKMFPIPRMCRNLVLSNYEGIDLIQRYLLNVNNLQSITIQISPSELCGCIPLIPSITNCSVQDVRVTGDHMNNMFQNLSNITALDLIGHKNKHKVKEAFISC
jgi:hypothetical protein